MTGHTPTPAQIIGELLAGSPEAASLQREASHYHALAVGSAALVDRLLTEAQADRLGYDEVRRRLDSRHRHPGDLRGEGIAGPWRCWAPDRRLAFAAAALACPVGSGTAGSSSKGFGPILPQFERRSESQ